MCLAVVSQSVAEILAMLVYLLIRGPSFAVRDSRSRFVHYAIKLMDCRPVLLQKGHALFAGWSHAVEFSKF